jgi:enediyne biosynthesis protein E4
MRQGTAKARNGLPTWKRENAKGGESAKSDEVKGGHPPGSFRPLFSAPFALSRPFAFLRFLSGLSLSAFSLGTLVLAGLISGCGRSAGEEQRRAMGRASGPIVFEDAQPTSGVDFRLSYAAGQEPGIKETIGYPAALIDADGDGLPDLLLAGTGAQRRKGRVALFRNRGGWRFQEVAGSGFRQKGYWQGAAVGDVDGDGRPDVYLSGYGCTALYLNQGGGRFRDVTAASGLANARADRWQTSAAFADVDRDGRLDLYVTCYVELGDKTGLCVYPHGITTACSPTQFAPQRGSLYRNQGGARFTDVTKAYGLSSAHGNGLGVAFADVDGDGYPDLYLANDQLPGDLYLNQEGRRFVNAGTPSGTGFGPDGSPQAGMGVDFGDYDNDGREDLVVTTYQREPTSLYHNDGGPETDSTAGDALSFTNVAYPSHLGAATTESVGWGVKWADFDNDGWLDLAIANGHPLYRIRQIEPSVDTRQRFQLFRSQGNGLFAELTSLGNGLPRAIAGRALCAGDLDNDGRTDLLISDIDGQPLLLRNLSPARNHWLTVRLEGRPGIEGAMVTVRAGARRWMRRSTTGGSYLSASDPRVHFGLGESGAVDEVRVRWPNGKTTVRRSVPVDREVTIQGEGR